MNMKQRETMVEVEVTLPDWLDELATQQQLDLNQILKDALIEELKLRSE